MFRLVLLQRKIERLNQSARSKSEEMKSANRPLEEIQVEGLTTWMEVRAVEEEIQKYKTDKLLKVANRLGLPSRSHSQRYPDRNRHHYGQTDSQQIEWEGATIP